ncbi:enolase C-terminal domain-like protein [Flavobacterium sedimenticola]|uniref:Enolase C-terminal domain-like protein n=1 Tax=Flavobacterium sedimenticola TaxID=3043286 RepID=A0ABT6XPB8_9FLAO|nr:enolase C-terminal domain-like protein [Flavobacterium sedimenticola]MDI9256934.1 enolase C-terminal domain-like protein [Flavobacterium sedimenticola]
MILHRQIVRFQLKEIFAIAYGNYTFREALIVTLESHGEKGYGECTAIDYYHINLNDFQLLLEQVKSQIEAHAIIHPTDFYRFLLSLELPSFLRSALDCAYWDLFGKLERKSFLALNNISYKQLPESSITISVDAVENQLQKIAESKWNHFKVKCNHFNESDIRKLLQSGKNIALDSNGSFTAADCHWFEANAVVSQFTYLEQPMKKGVEQYSVLHSDTFANWMADEDCQDCSDLERLKPHYKSINVKLVKCGGLTPALELITEARNLGYRIMIGCMTESTVGISAGAVLAPLCDYADLDGANLIANDIAKGSYIVNGKIQLSENHGLGIKLI